MGQTKSIRAASKLDKIRCHGNDRQDIFAFLAKKIGGRTGYYGADILWKFRGILDIFTGGVGLSRGRRSRKELRVGDALDFWRVLELEPESKLLLLAEMKTPGEGLLEIKMEALNHERCNVILLACFLPKGLIGLIYWYTLYPLH